MSSKKNLNTKISIESELVGASDYVPYNIWYIIFLHHQGYLHKSTIFFRYNQSATRMEMNGRNSLKGNSRHIYIRYLFIKDRVDKGYFRIMYFPTHLTLADYLTKTLQGALFHNF